MQTLTSNVTAIHVDITTHGLMSGKGTANPLNYFHEAMLRFGDAVGYFDAIPVVGGPQWLAVPFGTTRLGYACQSGAVISVVEVIGGTPPFGSTGALSSLTDVALTSPADAQVLAYQASSSKWINSTPTGGGGTSPSILGTYTQSTDINGVNISTSTFTNVGGAVTFTPAATGIVQISALGMVGMVNHVVSTAVRASTWIIIDGTTRYQIGGSDNSTNWLVNMIGQTLTLAGLSAASHTAQLQVYCDLSSIDIFCRAATLPNIENYKLIVVGFP